MIVEIRTYTLKVGAVASFLKAYEEHGYGLQTKVWGGLIGYYSSETGDPNQIVQLWRFADFADRQKRRAQLSAMPEWHEALGFFRPFIERQDSRLLNPAAFVEPVSAA